METDEFEWDDTKAASNFDKHGITFAEATFVFDDPRIIEDVDISVLYDEVRYKSIGWSGQRLLAVIYTERVPSKRIISAREARKHERDDYKKS